MTKIITQAPVVLSKEREAFKRENRVRQLEGMAKQKAALMEPTPDDIEYARKDSVMAERVCKEFIRLYPGHGWGVESDLRNGILKIFNSHISSRVGWLMKAEEVHPATLPRLVMRVGGEMLARSGLSTGALVSDEVSERQLILNDFKRVDLS